MEGAGKFVIAIILFIAFIIVGITDNGLNDMLGGSKQNNDKPIEKIEENENLVDNKGNNKDDNDDGWIMVKDDRYSDLSLVEISRLIESGEIINENGIFYERKVKKDKNDEVEVENDTGKDTLKKGEYVLNRVIDGDTISVISPETGKEERVRLLLIDTPESVHPDGLIEAYGLEASDYAKEYFKNTKTVTLELGLDERDKYDRLLAHVFVDGENFNLHMVEQGYARVAYVYEPNTKYVDQFKLAEKRAKKAKKNIWSIDGYVTDKGFDMSVVDDFANAS